MPELDETVMLAKEAGGVVPLRSSAPTAFETTKLSVQHILSQYEKEMDITKPFRIEVAVDQQMALLRGIKMVLRLEGQEFNEGWSWLLDWALQHRNGVASRAYISRGLDYAKRMGARDRQLVNMLTHLMIITADPLSRGIAMSRYNFDRVYKFFEKDSDAAIKLEAFYKA